eukprot:2804154-Amphidinium_carterae.3
MATPSYVLAVARPIAFCQHQCKLLRVAIACCVVVALCTARSYLKQSAATTVTALGLRMRMGATFVLASLEELISERSTEMDTVPC